MVATRVACEARVTIRLQKALKVRQLLALLSGPAAVLLNAGDPCEHKVWMGVRQEVERHLLTLLGFGVGFADVNFGTI